MEPLTFGPFCFDPAAARLLREGTQLELRPQALHALHVLARHGGQFVGYDQMIREGWSGTVVSKHTVAVTVGEVKKALGEYGRWICYRPNLGYCLEVPGSEELIRRAWHCTNLQTREGLERAREYFLDAGHRDPSNVRAWEGLGMAYLMLGTYGMWPPKDAYPGFLEALARGVAVAGLTPELRADRAHGWYVFERRIAEAEAEFLEVVGERPKLGHTYIRLAMLYATSGRLDHSLATLDRVRENDALMATLPGAEVFVRLCRREFGLAVECGRQAVALHPHVPLARALFGEALMSVGRAQDALDEFRRASLMFPDLTWLGAVEAGALARAGRKRDAEEILERLMARRAAEYIDAYFLAIAYTALGDRDRALEELERAGEENSATLFLVDVDPRLDELRLEPRFASVWGRVFGTAA